MFAQRLHHFDNQKAINHECAADEEAFIHMSLIDKKHLEKLRSAGLHVSHPINAFCNRVWVCKPVTTSGNCILAYKCSGYRPIDDGSTCPDIDAPMVAFFFEQAKWIVNAQECAGELGPADFINEWDGAELAVRDILDFYFGDPIRMQKKAAWYAEVDARLKH